MQNRKNRSAKSVDKKDISRRRFIAGAGAAALSFTVIKPALVRGTEANSKINIGMIGCGGRGTWITKRFGISGGYRFIGAADYFDDRVNKYSHNFHIDKAHCYTGLSGYKKLLEQKGLDAVAIISTPYFHPDQAADAIDAGIHVYLAKPISVDVPGCNKVLAAGKKATENKLCLLVDFQTRTNEFYREAVKRVQYGDIGRVVCGEVTYQTGRLELKGPKEGPEGRLRNWVFDKALSGDIITEQNIHSIDVACWIIDKNPVSAWGTGGRKVRTDVGDCWDYFSVIFEFANGVVVTFNSKQFGKGIENIKCRMFGATGTIDTNYGGEVNIRGDMPYKGGETTNIYHEGAVSNIADFYENVTKGRYANTTVPAGVRSNLATILGRTAAYTHSRVTWDDIIKADEKIDGRLQGLKA